jgi:hypothetical protein
MDDLVKDLQTFMNERDKSNERSFISVGSLPPLAASAATDPLSVTISHPFSTGERTWDSSIGAKRTPGRS